MSTTYIPVVYQERINTEENPGTDPTILVHIRSSVSVCSCKSAWSATGAKLAKLPTLIMSYPNGALWV
jgi:hypothetical protein